MNPEAQLLAALAAYRDAMSAARSAAAQARDILVGEPLANTLKAFTVLEQIAYVAPEGSPGLGLDSQVRDAIAQLEARAGAN